MILTADPKRVITVTFGDKTFRASQITYANLLDTQDTLERNHPGCRIHVIQPCFNTGVRASAGTHDFDAVLDVQIIGMTWPEAQTFLRRQGWAAWWRHTGEWAAESAWHIHMISLGAVKAGCEVGVFIDGGLSQGGHVVTSSQVADYRNRALGLAGQHDSGDDHTWHPPNIDATVFNYRKWRDDMPYSNWPDADKKALTRDVAAAVRDSVLDADVNANQPGQPAFKGMTVRELLKKLASKVGAV